MSKGRERHARKRRHRDGQRRTDALQPVRHGHGRHSQHRPRRHGHAGGDQSGRGRTRRGGRDQLRQLHPRRGCPGDGCPGAPGNPACGVPGGEHLSDPGQGLLLVPDDPAPGDSCHPGGRSRSRHVRGLREHAPHAPPCPGAAEGEPAGPHPPHRLPVRAGLHGQGVQPRGDRCGRDGLGERCDAPDAGCLGPSQPGALCKGLWGRQVPDRRGADARRDPPERGGTPSSSRRTSPRGR